MKSFFFTARYWTLTDIYTDLITDLNCKRSEPLIDACTSVSIQYLAVKKKKNLNIIITANQKGKQCNVFFCFLSKSVQKWIQEVCSKIFLSKCIPFYFLSKTLFFLSKSILFPFVISTYYKKFMYWISFRIARVWCPPPPLKLWFDKSRRPNNLFKQLYS